MKVLQHGPRVNAKHCYLLQQDNERVYLKNTNAVHVFSCCVCTRPMIVVQPEPYPYIERGLLKDKIERMIGMALEHVDTTYKCLAIQDLIPMHGHYYIVTSPECRRLFETMPNAFL